MSSLYELIVQMFGTELQYYPFFMMFFIVLFSAFIIYSIINIISTIFKWLGGM